MGGGQVNSLDTILYQKTGAIAWITLNRPKFLNAYNTAMRDSLYQVLEAVRDDPDIRGAVLSGSGERAFCAGADLNEFGSAPSQVIARHVRWQRDVWGLFINSEKPIVAALHGYVLGSGMEMALLCDFRIASDDACFGLPEAYLGLVPAAGGTQTLPRIVGLSPALDLLLTGRKISAQEAYNYGLVNQVVLRKHLLQKARGLLEKVIRHDPNAVRLAKRAVFQGIELPIAKALELEQRLAKQLEGNPLGRKQA
ncbi:MAG: hypothetical protein BZY82_01835 [SAR202 cluster bacterium Io17-Chloro-G3]|nr:MAG: hypothetical protein BZY82_01835 [SAR202 cluster bacterium Io17-Chloro-G3]